MASLEVDNTITLGEILGRIKSETSISNTLGLDGLGTWLQDEENLIKADNDTNAFGCIVQELIGFNQRQLSTMHRMAGRKTTFRTEGGSLLVETVKAASRFSARRPPRLAIVKEKLWRHVDQVLQNDALASRQPSMLQYYCLLVSELAEHSTLGYVSDLGGDVLHRLLRNLLQVEGSRGLQTSALAAASQLVRGGKDPSANMDWLCSRALQLLIGSVQVTEANRGWVGPSIFYRIGKVGFVFKYTLVLKPDFFVNKRMPAGRVNTLDVRYEVFFTNVVVAAGMQSGDV